MNLNALEEAVHKSPKRYSLNRKSRRRAEVQEIACGNIGRPKVSNGQPVGDSSSGKPSLCSSTDPHTAMVTAVDSSRCRSSENYTSPKQAKYTELGKTSLEQNTIGVKNFAGQCFTSSETNSSCPQMCELIPSTQQISEQFQRETRSLLEAMQNDQRYSKGYNSSGQPSFSAWGYNAGFSLNSYSNLASLPSRDLFPNMESAPSHNGSIGSPPAYHCYVAPQAYSAKYGIGSNQCVPRQAVYDWRHV